MNPQKGLSMIILLIIIAVLIIGGGVAVFLYVTSTTNPQFGSSAYTPSQVGITVPKPDSIFGFKNPQNQATPAAGPSILTQPATSSPSLTTQGSPIGQVDIITSLSTDRKTFTIKFESSSNFQQVSSISYNLSYDTGGGPKAIQGTFAIVGSTIGSDTNGKQYIQKDLTLGTCSNGTCVYDSNPKNFHLSVTTK